MSSEKAAGGSGENESDFWGAAAGEFDDSLAEEHASKIFALWELGADFQESIAPAKGDKADDGDGDAGWAAEPKPDAPVAEAAAPKDFAKTIVDAPKVPSPTVPKPASAKAPEAAAKPASEKEDKKGDKKKGGLGSKPAVGKGKLPPRRKRGASKTIAMGSGVAPAKAEAPKAETTEAKVETTEAKVETTEATVEAKVETTEAKVETTEAKVEAKVETTEAKVETPAAPAKPVEAKPAAPEKKAAPVAKAEPKPVAKAAPKKAEKPSPKAAPAAPEPRSPVLAAEDEVELPQAKSNTMFLVLGAAVALAAVGGLIYAFAGGDDDASAPTAAAPSTSGAPEAIEAPSPTDDLPVGVDVAPAAAGDEAEVAEAEPEAEAQEGEPAEPEGVEAQVEAEVEGEVEAEVAAVEAPSEAPVAEPPPVPEPPPAPTTGHLTVRTVPANASLTVDGRAVANPYEADLDLNTRLSVAATAEGFRSSTQRIRITEDRELTLTLAARPTPPERPPVASRTTPPAGRSSGRSPGRASSGRSTARPSGRRGRRSSGFSTANPYE